MPYHQEIELKLALPEKDLHRVEDAPLLQGAIASARKAQLSSVYFDTPKLKLRQSGVSLRIHRQRDVGAAARRQCQLAFVAGVTSGREEARVEPFLRSSLGAHRTFRRATHFWQ